MKLLLFVFLLAPLAVLYPADAVTAAAARLAGAARVDITPDYPVRLSGYGSRRTVNDGVAQHIFAKALAIGSDAEGPAVLVTVDNCGVPASLREAVLQRVMTKSKVTNDRFAVCSSHTHSAPAVVGFAPNIFSMDISAADQAGIERYTRDLIDKLERVVLDALAARRPAELAWAVGKVGFAMNRRLPTIQGFQNSPYPQGPTDHALPVLRATDAAGKVVAIFTSYACHCTTVSLNRVHGDWAGCAQEFLERDFPGTVVLTALGCGADQNPYPRGTYDLARQHGREITSEVGRVLTGKFAPLSEALNCRTEQLELPFDTLPTRAEWEAKARDKSATIAYHARKNLERLDRGETLPTRLPYMVQTWSFGAGLLMVFLPGEVVVDYSLRLKSELYRSRVWVNAYANDVPCYIPSRRVLEEGGYEAASAMLFYDRPTKFGPLVEEIIIEGVRSITPKTFLNSGSGRR